MGSLAVHVVPRSRDARVDLTASGVVVRVGAAPEDGRATDEARRTLAAALGTPPSAISLVRGGRSREKVFRIDLMTEQEAVQRLRARPR